jgi:prepilin-type N-terminal cleavage/methylation domain-containing protein
MKKSKTKGFSLIELLIVVAIILIIAAIAIPNLLRSRIAANEASTVGSLRTLNTAEVTYATTYDSVGFTCTLSDFGPPSSGNPTSTAAGLIDSVLAGGAKAGYTIASNASGCTSAGGRMVSYEWRADPVTVGTTGQNYFCTDTSGVLKKHTASVTNCLTTGSPIQ